MAGTLLRIRDPRIQPLEVWDRQVEGKLLYQWVGAEARRSGVPASEAAHKLRWWELHPQAQRLWLGGGLSGWLGPHAQGDVRFFQDPWTLLEAGAAAAGAAAFLDCGQTALKLGTRGLRLRVPRPSWADASFVSAHCRRLTARPLLLALPCTLTDDLVPGGSTWAGWEGDDKLVSRLTGGCSDVLVCNDAELAALGALALGAPGGTLVLTLGFGPGAAFLP